MIPPGFLLIAAMTFLFRLTPDAFNTDHVQLFDQAALLAPALMALNENRQVDPEPYRRMLQQSTTGLQPAVIHAVINTLVCAKNKHIDHAPILTVIDYSKPSGEKRLWIFDLLTEQLILHTYVSHGIKSGASVSHFFSNKNNSKASSLGIYRTQKPYHGREGLSLRLEGLEAGFNNNASNRYLVMHGGWYMGEPFIKKYGRSGRSWGCPAVPNDLKDQIINTIKDNSLLIAYYPDEQWLNTSQFLHCAHSLRDQSPAPYAIPQDAESEQRDTILYADAKGHSARQESDPLLILSADNYLHYFHKPVPVNRMLRRRLNQQEYIALSPGELNNLMLHPNASSCFNALVFVIAEVKNNRGYWTTEMRAAPLGTITSIQKISDNQTSSNHQYRVLFNNNKIITLHTTDQFIRWVGL